MSTKRTYLFNTLPWLLLAMGYSQHAFSVQMFVSPNSNDANQVSLTFIPDSNESLTAINSIVCPDGNAPTIKSGTNVGTCDVPANISNQYSATYQGAQLNGTLVKTPNLEIPEESIIQALTTACHDAAHGSALATRCEEGFANINEAAKAIVPSQTTAQIGQILKISGSELRNVRMRLNAIQRKATQSAPVSLNIDGKTYQFKGGAAGDELDTLRDGRLGVFVNGRFQTADKKQTGFEAGFNSDNYGVTAGLDYRFMDNLVMGLAFGYDNTDTAITNGSQQIDAFTGMFYGNLNLPHDMFIDWGASYSGMSFDTQRSITYTKLNNSLFNGIVKGKPDAGEYNLNLGFGKNIALGGWSVTPHARFDYIEISIDSDKEIGQGQETGLEFNYNSQLGRSFTSSTGASVAYAISTPWGVLTPEINFDWQHEFLNDGTKISGSLATVNNVLLTRSNAPDRDYFNLSGSIVGTFAEGRSDFLNYESRLGQSTISSHLVQLGVRIPF